jgi:hypothetical protein
MSDDYIDFLDNPRPGRQPGDLGGHEEWWAERQQALEKAGYMLRPRYRPGWRPSWTGTGKFYLDFEDGQSQKVSVYDLPRITCSHGSQRRLVMDATRVSDGTTVMMKRLLPEEGPYELQINRIFSSDPLASDPRNHCARLLEVIELPNDPPIMVHHLLRPFNKPRFQTFGEFVAFFEQISEVGISSFAPRSCITQFTRVYNLCTRTTLRTGTFPFGLIQYELLNLAIRDCTAENIMFDPSKMYPKSFHPAKIKRSRDFRGKAKGYTRTWRPPRYLLIDFGLSRQYDPANGPPLERPIHGGDKSAPEHRDLKIPCNPFPTDVYYLGNLVREVFIQVCSPHSRG